MASLKSIEVDVQFPGEDKFHRLFQTWVDAVDDMTEPFEKMAEDFAEQEQKVFAEEGPGWKPLALSTQWDRLRHGYLPSNPILVREGTLRASLTDLHDPLSAYTVSPNELTLGSDRLRTPTASGT